MPELGRPRVAVIGGGVSGLTAAYALRETHEVTLLESAERLGGHADTHDVEVRGRADLPVDTGFIVHNDRTYPVLGRVFRELGVEVRDTEMSMSISCAECGLAYVGGRGLTGVLAQPRRVADRMFIALLKQIPRFHRVARQLLRDAPRSDRRTLGQFVGDHRFSRYFVHHFVVPLVSCVWSSGHQDALGYPARFLFEFLHHHGMLSVTGSPTWRTVVGGSRVYVDRIADTIPDVRLGVGVRTLARTEHGVEVTTDDGTTELFDQAVLAVHADTAHKLLSDPDPAVDQALAAFDYSVNPTVLHTDSTALPPIRARGSWNFSMPSCSATSERVQVSYWMNRLHGYESILDEDLVVSLNPGESAFAPQAVLDTMTYSHPVFTPDTVAAAEVLREAGDDVLAFAGAHLGWGFHEDGARSGLAAARRLGASW